MGRLCSLFASAQNTPRICAFLALGDKAAPHRAKPFFRRFGPKIPLDSWILPALSWPRLKSAHPGPECTARNCTHGPENATRIYTHGLQKYIWNLHDWPPKIRLESAHLAHEYTSRICTPGPECTARICTHGPQNATRICTPDPQKYG